MRPNSTFSQSREAVFLAASFLYACVVKNTFTDHEIGTLKYGEVYGPALAAVTDLVILISIFIYYMT